MGREGMAGSLQAVNVIAVLEVLGGFEDDLNKVLLIEEEYQRLNPKDQDGTKGGEDGRKS